MQFCFHPYGETLFHIRVRRIVYLYSLDEMTVLRYRVLVDQGFIFCSGTDYTVILIFVVFLSVV
jgi:hypothetical protein